MPFAIVLIVGLIFYSGIGGELKDPRKKTDTQISKTAEVKPIVEEVKSIPKQPEPIKEEVKIEAKQPEPIKEEVKIEAKQPEPIKETVKKESAEPKESVIKEVKEDETQNDYLKIILYIIAAIASIFGGFYFFSNRGNSQASTGTVDLARKDIEESYQSDHQEQQTAQEETQKQQSAQEEIQEQQTAQEETQKQQSTQEEIQEQQPTQEETQPESQEQKTTEDEDNNK